VDERKLALITQVWVGILVSRPAVRRPPRVPDSRLTIGQRCGLEVVAQDAQLSGMLAGVEVASVVDDRNTRRVVTSVLESFETTQKHLDAAPGSDIPHDSAHSRLFYGPGRSALLGGTVVPMSDPSAARDTSPFDEIDRQQWAALAPATAHPLTESELVQLRGLGDSLDMREVDEVYVPLSRLLSLYAVGARDLHQATRSFLGEPGQHTPFVIGVAGSVAVGKSTIARLLRELLSRWPDTPRVERVTTDGFLFSTAELERRAILHRKGFPESYDRRALLRFVARVKAGADEVRAPVYSHLNYDRVLGAEIVVRRPDILIVEGLNVLQPPAPGASLAVSDLFDFTIYVDARTSDIAQWYEERFLALQRGAFTDPRSYFHRYSTLSHDEAVEKARAIWRDTNEPNLVQNILPTRARASLVLRKASDHTVETVLLRKI